MGKVLARLPLLGICLASNYQHHIQEMNQSIQKHRIKVVAHSLEGNAFGAYLAGSLQDGEAIILLDLFCNLAVDTDPSKTLAETMAHEVLHVCQEALGQSISESDINAAMAKIQGYEFEEAEDLEQMIQDLTRKHMESEAENARLLKALCSESAKLCDYEQGLTQTLLREENTRLRSIAKDALWFARKYEAAHDFEKIDALWAELEAIQ